MSKSALITGITGQDGSYLAEFLIEKGYKVYGIHRKTSDLFNISHLLDKISLHVFDLIDTDTLDSLIQKIQLDECYHLAAISFVGEVQDEFELFNQNFHTTHSLLASIFRHQPSCRFFFAGSAEMFGEPLESPQNETSLCNPKSFYGVTKASSYYLVNYYRNHHELFACTGILYNHESPRRGKRFVTRKITLAAAEIQLGFSSKLLLGNLDVYRDWGYAPDYVQAMWLMLQQKAPRNYVISTGILHSVREFLEIAFGYLQLDYRDYIEVDLRYFREAEQIPLQGNPYKISSELGWKSSINFQTMIQKMVQSDLQFITNHHA